MLDGENSWRTSSRPWCWGGNVNMSFLSLCFRPAEPNAATWRRSTAKTPFWTGSDWPAKHPTRSWLSSKMETAGRGSPTKSVFAGFTCNHTFSDPQNHPAIICTPVDPPSVVLQGSVSLWGHLREKTVLRIPQKLIYRGRGYGQVNLYNLRGRKAILSGRLGLDLDRAHHYWQ